MDNQEIIKIHQLIQSADQRNLAVAFEIFQSATYSQELLTYLFVLAFFHPNEAIRQKAKPMFKEVGPKGFYADIADELVFTKIVPKSGIPSVFIFTALLEKIFKKKVLDLYTLGKYVLEWWSQSWEFCWKHQILATKDILQKVKNGRSLQLAGSIRKLPEEIWELKGVENLTIINRNLSYISKNIGQLSELKYLNIQSKLEIFPVGITRLSKLQELKLFISNDQFFHTVPVEVAQLTALKALTFTSLSGQFPVNFCLINSLKSIDLGYSNFEDFPQEIIKLQNLEKLKLNFNENLQLANLFIKLSKISTLKSLDLSFCKLMILPDEIALLDQVETLNVSGCYLTTLPTHIEDMVSLQNINLTHNQFKGVPKVLYQLPHLQTIKTDDGIIDLKKAKGE